jgi:DNA-directed RNA polymerase specialized sigma24 family protein
MTADVQHQDARVREPVTQAETEPAELVQRAGNGDREAWALLVKRYGPRMRSAALRCGLERPEAEDCVQETWAKLLRVAKAGNAPEYPGRWLITVVRHQAMYECKSYRRFLPAPNDDFHDLPALDGPGISTYLVAMNYDGMLGKAIERVLLQMPQLEATVLTFVYLNDGPAYGRVRELAKSLGAQGTDVETVLKRARRHFRAQWVEGGPEMANVLSAVLGREADD